MFLKMTVYCEKKLAFHSKCITEEVLQLHTTVKTDTAVPPKCDYCIPGEDGLHFAMSFDKIVTHQLDISYFPM
jgi:hypothetical protein